MSLDIKNVMIHDVSSTGSSNVGQESEKLCSNLVVDHEIIMTTMSLSIKARVGYR